MKIDVTIHLTIKNYQTVSIKNCVNIVDFLKNINFLVFHTMIKYRVTQWKRSTPNISKPVKNLQKRRNKQFF